MREEQPTRHRLQTFDQSPAEALDDLLAAQLEAEQREYDETVQSALRGYEDVKAGRTSSAEDVFEWLRTKHGL